MYIYFSSLFDEKNCFKKLKFLIYLSILNIIVQKIRTDWSLLYFDIWRDRSPPAFWKSSENSERLKSPNIFNSLLGPEA